jgi:hypothetical protein
MNRAAIYEVAIRGDPTMSQQVDAILREIEQLDESDRALLDRRLAELAEAQWQIEAKKARAIALDLGIDQQTIDKAVDDVRYGS